MRVHLGCRATRDGGFSGGRGAEEIRIMRGLPYPLHIAPFVIVEICAQKAVVGEAVVIGFQFPLPLGWNAPLPLHAARCTCGSSVVGQPPALMSAQKTESAPFGKRVGRDGECAGGAV